MDSKLVRIGMLIVGLFTVTVLLIVLATNGVLGKGSQTTSESVITETTSYEGMPVVQEWQDFSGWMSDDSFFDDKGIKEETVKESELLPVSVRVSTIDKDVRIVLLNEKGKPITGKRFRADIEGVGKYTDTDKDGIIYVPDVSPGEYNISMFKMAGYSIPEKAIKVSVKAQIDYKAVADISYLIKTEADIDAEAEDTAQNDASDESTGNSAVKTVDGAAFGIDVSKYNKEIDWKKVKEQGVRFVIIRCGYRGSKTGAIVEDPYFRKNIEGATKEEIPVGVYFFTQAVDEREAVEEASAVLSLIKGYKLTYPVFIDSESAGGKGRADDLDVVARSRVLQAFCETIRSGHLKAGIYASKNWFNNRLDISKLSADNVTWLAQYADQPTYGGTFQIWQYSSAGRIPGIEGRVDMNLSYLDVGDDNVTTASGDSSKADVTEAENKDDTEEENTKPEEANDGADSKGDNVKEDDNTSKEKDEDGQNQSRDM